MHVNGGKGAWRRVANSASHIVEHAPRRDCDCDFNCVWRRRGLGCLMAGDADGVAWSRARRTRSLAIWVASAKREARHLTAPQRRCIVQIVTEEFNSRHAQQWVAGWFHQCRAAGWLHTWKVRATSRTYPHRRRQPYTRALEGCCGPFQHGGRRARFQSVHLVQRRSWSTIC